MMLSGKVNSQHYTKAAAAKFKYKKVKLSWKHEATANGGGTTGRFSHAGLTVTSVQHHCLHADTVMLPLLK